MEFGLKEVGVIFIVLYLIYFIVRFVVYCKKEKERESGGKSKRSRSTKWK